MAKEIQIAAILTCIVLIVEGLTQVSDDDLRKFSSDLLDLDNNVAQPVYHLQEKLTRQRNMQFVNQPLSLFEPLNANILKRDTYAKFIKLLDNYDWKVEVPEQITDTERNEINDFLTAILETPVMKKVHEYLIQNGVINRNQDFKQLLYDYWFTLYPRKGRTLGSSGFEHVFVGEISKNEISGLHNWIQFYLLEQAGHINYQGFFSHLVLKKPVSLIKYKFAWKGYTKPTTSMLISTSPEFEIGLYTVCFFLRPNAKCPIRLGDKTISIQTFKHNYKGNEYVGSAYPTFG